jgi:hypothetical protein
MGDRPRPQRNHDPISLSRLRLVRALFVALHDSQGLRWMYSNPPPHGPLTSRHRPIENTSPNSSSIVSLGPAENTFISLPLTGRCVATAGAAAAPYFVALQQQIVARSAVRSVRTHATVFSRKLARGARAAGQDEFIHGLVLVDFPGHSVVILTFVVSRIRATCSVHRETRGSWQPPSYVYALVNLSALQSTTLTSLPLLEIKGPCRPVCSTRGSRPDS